MKSNWLVTTLGALALATGLAFCGEPKEEPKGEPKGEPKPAPDKRAGKDYAPFPNPDAGYVTDLADLLTRDQEEQIEQWLWQVERKTGVEMVVVTIDSIRDYPRTPNRSIEQFATALFNKYGIGNLPKNDGVLLLVARKDRKARIELGAFYGRKRDADATRIMERTILPRFKEEEYARGITEGVQELIREFAGVRVQAAPGQRGGTTNWPLILTGGAILVVGVIAHSLFKAGKRGWGWVAVGVLILLVLAFLQLLYRTLRAIGERAGDSDSPGSSSGWSAGGFGGGFGGGFSGGGGATGSW